MIKEFSNYDVKTLKFEEKTYVKKMTFRNVGGRTYIHHLWIKCSKFVVPDDKFCKEIKERACIRLLIPTDSEFVSYLSKFDACLDSRSSETSISYRLSCNIRASSTTNS